MRELVATGLLRADNNIPDNLGVTLGWGDDWPFMAWIKSTAGNTQGVLLIVIGVLLLFGLGMWIAGRLSHSQRVQAVSVAIIPTALVGAMVAGAAFGLIGWAAGFNIGFN